MTTQRVTLASGHGHVVVERHGGRVAELRPGPDLPNLLWRGDGTPVPGGDRLWPAPELEVFYENPADPASWRCPPELDPGDWQLTETPDGVALRQGALGAAFSREVEPLADRPWTLPWAGYRVTDEVRSDRGWSAWHVVMVPAPAQVFVRRAGSPVVYYPPAPPVAGGWIEASGKAPRWKLGFAPPPDGRVLLAALGPEDPGPLVVLLAEAPPSGTYVDRPPDGGPGTAVQVYDAGGEGFCELEHHAPREQGRTQATVIGAWGPRTDREDLLRNLES